MIRKRHLPVVVAVIAMAAIALLLAIGMPRPAKGQDAGVARGERIAAAKCARCHAIGRRDASPNPKAPPFRMIGKLYPLDHLAEAFAEGIVTGDNDMPEFKFEPRDVDAIIAFLAAMSKTR